MAKKATKFREDIDAMSHDDLKAEYKRLLESRKSLKQHNDRLSKWCAACSNSMTTLAQDAAVAFQAMAEKAGVRNHPSVVAVVKLFDAIMHPQWHREEHHFPKVEFPTDWDFSPPGGVWSGDADMSLNSPIADVIEFLEAYKFGGKPKIETVFEMIQKLHSVTQKGVDGVKSAAGFKPYRMEPLPAKHFSNMSEDELRQMLGTVSWMALDLAQDMEYANQCLRRDLRASTYRRVAGDLYRMSHLTIEPHEDTGFDVKIMGGEQAIM